MKKTLALLLAVVMVFALVASGCTDSGSAASTTTTVEAAPAEATYTYNTYVSTFPTLWSYTTYETNQETVISDYIGVGLYSFDYNEAKDGYVVVPEAAVAEPVDVTADYVGQYGLEEGDQYRAWEITIRDDMKWDDGTPITALDYVESIKRYEDPEAMNYRADNWYSGSLVIYNAQNYLYAGRSVNVENAANEYYELADLTLNEDGVYCTPNGGEVYAAIGFPLNEWLGGDTLYDYVDAYGEDYFDITNWDALVELMDDEGLVPLTEETYAMLASVTTGNPAWGESEEDVPAYFVYSETYPEMSWDEVGVIQTGEYSFVLILTKELQGFYLLYSLADPMLVKTDLYDSCISYVDGVYTNTYGTSVETTASYGPYSLVSFQADKEFVLERNPYFYGFEEGKYQTDRIVNSFVPEPATAREMFIQGKLDEFGLNKDDMETYGRSDFCYYDPSDSTFAMAFNPDFDALVAMQAAAGANINKTILTIPEFRQAMSFGINRQDFCLATSPTNGPAFGLFSSLIISDPDAGTAYRTTDEAKSVIVNFWGLTEDIGDGKLYADADEAIESLTGYNLTKAQELFDVAYDKAIELGYMDEDDVIEIKIGTPNNTSVFYNNGYEYIVNNYSEAVKGTKLEGKLTFTRDDTLGNGFADALKSNQVDMLFGVGWTGSALDPYNLMEAYTDANYVYDPAFDTTVVPMTFTVDGVEYTASIRDWNYAMMGETIIITDAEGNEVEYSCGLADNDPVGRMQLLAALENAVLMQYDFIPLMDDSTATLRGMKISYYTEDYVFGLGHGGIKYFTYNYSDAEWDAFVASNNNELDYT